MWRCDSCGGEIRDGARVCAQCGTAACPTCGYCCECGTCVCPACGEARSRGARFCGECGAGLPVPGRGDGNLGLARGVDVREAGAAATVGPGAPGLGIAGFVLSLLGISLLGLILSWIGLAQAKREGRPTGMCSAGIIISIAWMILSVGLVLYSRSAAGF